MSGIYLHIPFCEKKCSYCDFYSIESTPLMETFVTTLIKEIHLRHSSLVTRHSSLVTRHSSLVTRHSSLFLGGGTPSLLLPSQLERILTAIRSHWEFEDGAEWTMECNPGTVTLEKLRAYRELGINRLSFGVQSFNASELAFLERIHTAEEAEQAMELARAAGFTNVNMDLMFALPPQTMESLDNNITRMLALEPDHISAYSLIYEHGTPLYAQLQKGLVTPHEEELDAEMYAHVMQRLTSAGYVQYEVSNFAKPGMQCKHNLLYWHAQQYVAMGPSAHGYVDDVRYWNIRSLAAWTQHVNDGLLPEANRETLGRTERMFERAFLGLRADGIDVVDYAAEFGVNVIEALGNDARIWLEEGLITIVHDRLALTSAGYQLCDELTLRTISAIERVSGEQWKDDSAADPIDHA
ncbi:MAG: radical SAM family heme chaperone HemW [Bacteroidetes bacterium]|nr:radical SAM family heme chaperone HemW [Bacteroidota bacterium]